MNVLIIKCVTSTSILDYTHSQTLGGSMNPYCDNERLTMKVFKPSFT